MGTILFGWPLIGQLVASTDYKLTNKSGPFFTVHDVVWISAL